jgi:hypothetical protein
MLEAILTLYEAEDIINHLTPPTGVAQDDWDAVQRRGKAYMRLYTKPDVYSLVASDVDYPSFKAKVGSTEVHLLWTSWKHHHL